MFAGSHENLIYTTRRNIQPYPYPGEFASRQATKMAASTWVVRSVLSRFGSKLTHLRTLPNTSKILTVSQSLYFSLVTRKMSSLILLMFNPSSSTVEFVQHWCRKIRAWTSRQAKISRRSEFTLHRKVRIRWSWRWWSYSCLSCYGPERKSVRWSTRS